MLIQKSKINMSILWVVCTMLLQMSEFIHQACVIFVYIFEYRGISFISASIFLCLPTVENGIIGNKQ